MSIGPRSAFERVNDQNAQAAIVMTLKKSRQEEVSFNNKRVIVQVFG